jgi:hypothetical protein
MELDLFLFGGVTDPADRARILQRYGEQPLTGRVVGTISFDRATGTVDFNEFNKPVDETQKK